jgi:hypothetical protein
MKAYGGVDVQIHIFLTSALVRGEWSASRPGRFTPEERAPGTHWIGGWVNPRAGLDDVEKWKFLTLPGLVQPATRRYTDWAIPAPQTRDNMYYRSPSGIWGYVARWRSANVSEEYIPSIFSEERNQRRHVLPKSQLTLNGQCGFITIGVRTLNPTHELQFSIFRPTILLKSTFFGHERKGEQH